MDLDPIGKHCTLQSCNALDFLPIQCNCLQWFCKLHLSPDLHNCPATQQRTPDEPSSIALARPKCTFSGCNKPSLETQVDSTSADESHHVDSKGCPSCHLTFCVECVRLRPQAVRITDHRLFHDHRHMQSHSCTGVGVRNNNVKLEAARAILAEKFPTTSAPSSYTPVVAPRRKNFSSDPQKLAQLQKVHLMKLRQKAVPGDPKDKGSMLSVDQRIHVTVRLEISGRPAKEIVLWFRKTAVTGRVLDLVVQHFGLSHMTSTFQLKQLSAETASMLQNHLELGAQLEDGSIVVLTNSRSDK